MSNTIVETIVLDRTIDKLGNTSSILLSAGSQRQVLPFIKIHLTMRIV
jgi:hypothetical protein